MKTITFIGNRIQDLGGFKKNRLQENIYKNIEEKLLANKDVLLITSLSLGIEFWAGEIAKKHGIPYKVVVPFKSFEAKWSQYDRIKYGQLLTAAKQKKILDDGFYAYAKLKAKDVFLLEESDEVCLFFNNIPSYITKCITQNNKKAFDLMPSGDQDDVFIPI